MKYGHEPDSDGHHVAARALAGGRASKLRDISTSQSSLEDIFVEIVEAVAMNIEASNPSISSKWHAHVAPSAKRRVRRISTSLYFIVFGAAIVDASGKSTGIPTCLHHGPALMMLTF